MWDELIIIVEQLDTNSRDKSLARKRAETLYHAGCYLLKENTSFEASMIIKVVYKAVEKSIDGVDDIVLSLILR